MRPSDLLDAPDPYAAWCLDNAVGQFGRTLEGELKSIEGKNRKEIESKSDRLIRKWLDIPQQYRDPAKSGMISKPSDG